MARNHIPEDLNPQQKPTVEASLSNLPLDREKRLILRSGGFISR